MGLVSFGAAIVLTLPGGIARPVQGAVGDIWPNSVVQIADTIWPNSSVLDDVIWPNTLVPD
jgi:hypothetical protein